LLVIVTAVIGWQLVKHGTRGLVRLLSLAAVVFAISPGAYAAARAEVSLPSRDLAFDYDGDAKSATLFNTIVKDRLRRTRIAAEYPDTTWIATNFGRRFVTA
jgi:hypothetical protein